MIAAIHPWEEGSARASDAPAKSPRQYHEPVLVAETISALAPAPGKVILDGTLGGGGHTGALLAAGARVIALDQDPDALAYASGLLAGYAERFTPVRSNFADGGAILDELGVHFVDGILLDLGVSSHQLDTPERGFSFQKNGPLDMRMNPAGSQTAADLVNTASAEELERIFKVYGEEPSARRIAARLVQQRSAKSFETTLELAEAIERIVPRRGKTHPATKVFQALRIAVNREIEVLESALQQLSLRLTPGGRFAIITFHSLEDRPVKRFFKSRSVETIDRPEWPAPRPNPDRLFRLLTPKAVTASDAEQRANPRSRSAKLRAVERLPS